MVDAIVPRAGLEQPSPGPTEAAWSGSIADLARILDAELSGSLNTRRTVLRVLDLAASRLADWAMVVIAEPKGPNLHMYGGTLELVAPNPMMVNLVKITGLDDVFEVRLPDPPAEQQQS